MYTTRMDQKYTNDKMFKYYKDLDENLEVIKETFSHTQSKCD